MELIKVKNNTPSFLHISSLNKNLSPGQTFHLTSVILETNMEVIDCLAKGWLIECKEVMKPAVKQQEVVPKKVSVESQAKIDADRYRADNERSEACVMTPDGAKMVHMRNYSNEMGLPTFVDENDVITEEDSDLANLQAEAIAIGQIKASHVGQEVAADAGLDSLDGDGSKYSGAFLEDFQGGPNGKSDAFVD